MNFQVMRFVALNDKVRFFDIFYQASQNNLCNILLLRLALQALRRYLNRKTKLDVSFDQCKILIVSGGMKHVYLISKRKLKSPSLTYSIIFRTQLDEVNKDFVISDSNSDVKMPGNARSIVQYERCEKVHLRELYENEQLAKVIAVYIDVKDIYTGNTRQQTRLPSQVHVIFTAVQWLEYSARQPKDRYLTAFPYGLDFIF